MGPSSSFFSLVVCVLQAAVVASIARHDSDNLVTFRASVDADGVLLGGEELLVQEIEQGESSASSFLEKVVMNQALAVDVVPTRYSSSTRTPDVRLASSPSNRIVRPLSSSLSSFVEQHQHHAQAKSKKLTSKEKHDRPVATPRASINVRLSGTSEHRTHRTPTLQKQQPDPTSDADVDLISMQHDLQEIAEFDADHGGLMHGFFKLAHQVGRFFSTSLFFTPSPGPLLLKERSQSRTRTGSNRESTDQTQDSSSASATQGSGSSARSVAGSSSALSSEESAHDLHLGEQKLPQAQGLLSSISIQRSVRGHDLQRRGTTAKSPSSVLGYLVIAIFWSALFFSIALVVGGAVTFDKTRWIIPDMTTGSGTIEGTHAHLHVGSISTARSTTSTMGEDQQGSNFISSSSLTSVAWMKKVERVEAGGLANKKGSTAGATISVTSSSTGRTTKTGESKGTKGSKLMDKKGSLPPSQKGKAPVVAKRPSTAEATQSQASTPAAPNTSSNVSKTGKKKNSMKTNNQQGKQLQEDNANTTKGPGASKKGKGGSESVAAAKKGPSDVTERVVTTEKKSEETDVLQELLVPSATPASAAAAVPLSSPKTASKSATTASKSAKTASKNSTMELDAQLQQVDLLSDVLVPSANAPAERRKELIASSHTNASSTNGNSEEQETSLIDDPMQISSSKEDNKEHPRSSSSSSSSSTTAEDDHLSSSGAVTSSAMNSSSGSEEEQREDKVEKKMKTTKADETMTMAATSSVSTSTSTVRGRTTKEAEQARQHVGVSMSSSTTTTSTLSHHHLQTLPRAQDDDFAVVEIYRVSGFGRNVKNDNAPRGGGGPQRFAFCTVSFSCGEGLSGRDAGPLPLRGNGKTMMESPIVPVSDSSGKAKWDGFREQIPYDGEALEVVFRVFLSSSSTTSQGQGEENALQLGVRDSEQDVDQGQLELLEEGLQLELQTPRLGMDHPLVSNAARNLLRVPQEVIRTISKNSSNGGSSGAAASRSRSQSRNNSKNTTISVSSSRHVLGDEHDKESLLQYEMNQVGTSTSITTSSASSTSCIRKNGMNFFPFGQYTLRIRKYPGGPCLLQKTDEVELQLDNVHDGDVGSDGGSGTRGKLAFRWELFRTPRSRRGSQRSSSRRSNASSIVDHERFSSVIDDQYGTPLEKLGTPLDSLTKSKKSGEL
ncbi:unnamed protein product [Amoebophrya sp. A25]|nr:unnamed protein product [Amoebophrya sp. A25]|eukprot:GSA25T00014409001.1